MARSRRKSPGRDLARSKVYPQNPGSASGERRLGRSCTSDNEADTIILPKKEIRWSVAFLKASVGFACSDSGCMGQSNKLLGISVDSLLALGAAGNVRDTIGTRAPFST